MKFKETDQTHLIIGMPTFSILDPRNPAMSVMSTVLGRGMSSRLFARMRDELGISAKAHVVLFAGGSVPEIKGQWEFLQAMELIRRQDTRLVCLMPSFSPSAMPDTVWQSWTSR